MPDPLHVGLIGGGRISDMHAPGYRNYAHGRLFAVADIDEATARRRCEEWQADRYYTDYQEMLADPDVHAVEIITPHHLHREMALAAIAAGKHVSLQKPMALNLKECREIANAAQAAGVVLRVYENFVFYPPFVKLKDMMNDGAIGEPLSLRVRLGGGKGGWPVPLSTWVWRMRGHTGGGGPTLFDDGYHKFSMAVALFGPVKALRARVRWWLGVVDTPAVVCFQFHSGKVGIFDSGHSLGMEVFSDQYGADEQVEVTGTEGTLIMTRCTARHAERPSLLLHRGGTTTAFHDLADHWQDSFTAATRHFVQCIREGEQPQLSAEEGMAIQALAEASYASAEQDGALVDMAAFMEGQGAW